MKKLLNWYYQQNRETLDDIAWRWKAKQHLFVIKRVLDRLPQLTFPFNFKEDENNV